MADNKSFFRKLMEKYDELCKDLGVENGACRSCVPVVKFDPEKEESECTKNSQDLKKS